MKNNNNKLPSLTTIYKFYNKLKKYKNIYTTYNNLLNKYINKHKLINLLQIIIKWKWTIIIIINKYKNKISKISLITDLNGIFYLDINLLRGNTNDSTKFFNQLDNFININAIRKNNKNIFVGDTPYDSNNIRNKLKNVNL